MRGHLRAPPRGLAEVTATRVPGERVLSDVRGDWGRHVPLVDDLLASGILSSEPTKIVSPLGTTVISPPKSVFRRVAAWLRLSVRYAQFVELRRRALDAPEDPLKRGFVDRVEGETGIRIRFIPHRSVRPLGPPPELPDIASAMLLPAVQVLDDASRDFLHYLTSPLGNRLPHVGAYVGAIFVGMIARAVATRRSVDADRKAMGLVIGGWGTRGKSGTERLKAALFQGLGFEVLVKTTGCEAMFIHAIPGVRAHEVFLYRPYDKATVWEQRSVLRLARRFGARVFLWECMALQPELVNLLQDQWMRDDYSTITNAYPDHEDVQGPAGIDVADVISEFVPTRGRLFTAEDQMLPLIRERAKHRGTSVRAVGEREAALISDDILARFPYHEHPKNIALVSALAQAFGIPAAVALAEMADHVVPDLGVLKTYPRVTYEGRSLAFTNGMSANERTGALSNWTRMGFDRHDTDAEPARWIITVVNNRADRVARSEVFARFIVEDIDAHRHVLIGTNLPGLVGFIREALERHLDAIRPSRDLPEDPSSRKGILLDRIGAAFLRLKIGTLDVASVERELRELNLPALPSPILDDALVPRSPEEGLSEARAAVDARLPADYPVDARPFVVASIARRRAARAVYTAVDAWSETDRGRIDRVFHDAYTAIFGERLVPLRDATLTGDQIVDVVARSAPPGARVDIIGLQNIKGTGLDFVYRWVSLDAVTRAVEQIRSGSDTLRDEGVRTLFAHDDYGLIDSTHALEKLRPLRGIGSEEQASILEALVQLLEVVARERRDALATVRSPAFGDRVRRVIGSTLDYLDSMGRQSKAKRILGELVAGRMSHATAAVEMRAVVARAKGAWALRRAR
jgi:poly-gamma-glutamate synthase PgsB/CapB